MRRGWLGMYGMVIMKAVVHWGVYLVTQFLRLPLILLILTLRQPVALELEMVFWVPLLFLSQVVTVAVLDTGWATLYLHYRLEAETPGVDDRAKEEKVANG